MVGRVKQTKTRLSRRAVPLQAIALEALDQLQAQEHRPLLFPNSRGYENTFLLCYVRGPEGLIVELAERLDGTAG